MRSYTKYKQLKNSNLLELIPVPLINYEKTTDNRIVLLVKRFPFKFLSQLFKKSEYIRITLDEKGSVFWNLIDGKKTIAQICKEISFYKIFDNEEMLEERLSAFALILYRQKAIDFITLETLTNN